MSKKPQTITQPQKNEKLSSEILTFTYGSIISQLIEDYDEPQEVNKILQEMGRNIGSRVVHEFISQQDQLLCTSFAQVLDTLAQYLGVSFGVRNNLEEGENIFYLNTTENPLTNYVELPEKWKDLDYSNIVCGIIEGVCHSVLYNVVCKFTKDILKGDNISEIRVECKEPIIYKMVD